ncbi:MAG TPA: Gfo/Idh/MocA family oxidoreductase [Bauldia sp.]|nr:Gfo/Idh/MocA family oxidoreductase [Bauldia sp.]
MLRAVLVGCGAMSRTNIEAALATGDVTFVGLVDIDPSRAENRAAEFSLASAEIGTDLAAVLGRTNPDLVLDVVVPSARFDVVTTAFDHGCHVLSEKPMADSMAHAEALVGAARKHGLLHAVVQNRRYVEGVRRIRRFIESGAIGRITSLHCDFFLAPHFGGFREEMDHVLLLDMAIHTFDAARYLAGEAVRAVYCREFEPANSWYRQGSSAAAVFEFDRGVVFTYRGSWCADGLRTSWESAWRIVGERGTLTWDGFDDIRAERRTAVREGLFDKPEPVAIPPIDASDRVGGHRGVMQDFVAALRKGSEPETVGHENIKSLAMVFGAIESAETGRRIELGDGHAREAQAA